MKQNFIAQLKAHRGGIKIVLIPEANVKDLVEIPENIKNVLEIHPVKWIDQVLELALEKMPEALPEVAAVVTADTPNVLETTLAITH